MSRKFKKVKSKYNYISYTGKAITKWVRQNLGLTDFLLILSSFLFSTNISFFILKFLFSIGLLYLYGDDIHPCRCILAYNIASVIIFYMGFSFSEFIYIIVNFFFFILLHFFAEFTLWLLYIFWSLYLELLKKFARIKLKTSFPLDRNELEHCGVHDRLDCLLYYHHMLRGFGLFKDPIINIYDPPINQNIHDLKEIFYSFKLSTESSKIIENAVKENHITENVAKLISKSYYGDYYSFVYILKESNEFYLSQMKKPFWKIKPLS